MKTAHLLSGEQKIQVLSALLEVFYTDSEILSQNPGVLWQQLYNTLSYKDDLLKQFLELHLPEHSTSPSPVWLKFDKQLQVKSPALVRAFSHVLANQRQWTDDCAISPDGTLVASLNAGTLYVWEQLTGKLLYGGIPGGYLCTFSPDGSRLYTTSVGFAEDDSSEQAEDSDSDERKTRFELLIRDTKALESYQIISIVREYNEQTARVIAVSPDGNHIITSADNKMILWNRTTGEARHLPVGHKELIYGCVYSSDNAYVISTDEREIVVWNPSTWQVVRKWYGDSYTSSVRALAAIPGTHWIATAHSEGTLMVWDIESGKSVVGPMIHHQSREYSTLLPGLRDCAVNQDGTLLASVGKDLLVKIWDVQTGQHLASYQGHTAMISACAFSGKSNYLVSSDWDGNVLVWDPTVRSKENVFSNFHTDAIRTCAFSPNGRFFATGSDDKTLKVWDTAIGRLHITSPKARDYIRACAMSPDNTSILYGDEDGRVYLLNAEDGKEIWSIGGHRIITHIAISPDGAWCAIANDNYCTCRQFTDGGSRQFTDGSKRSSSQQDESEVYSCVISPDNTWFASCKSGNIAIYDSISGDLLHILRTQTRPYFSAVSPDGTFLVAATSNTYGYEWEHPIEVWDTATWTLRFSISFKSLPLVACCALPDGMGFLVATKDGKIHLWNADNGELRATFIAPMPLASLTIHPWQPYALAGGLGGIVTLMGLMGMEYGPIVVTATSKNTTLFVQCPVCQQEIRVATEQFGEIFNCPTKSCQNRQTKLQVNRFYLNGQTDSSTIETEEIEIFPERSTKESAYPFSHREHLLTVSQAKSAKYRTRLLATMKKNWIQGVLDWSLNGRPLIDLQMEYLSSEPTSWPDSTFKSDLIMRDMASPATTITDFFDQSGGSLLILGNPGSGKTTMLLELARNLIIRAEQDSGYPIPVIFRMDSWTKMRQIRGGRFVPQTITDWFVEEMNDEYKTPKNIGRFWVTTGQILPLLDQADEFDRYDRDEFIQTFNQYSQNLEIQQRHFAICYRQEEYSSLLERPQLTGAVLLNPLSIPQIEQYLHAVGAPYAGICEAFQEDTVPSHEAESAFVKLIQHPFMLQLIMDVYKDTPHQKLPSFSTVTEWREHLFEAYIDQALLKAHQWKNSNEQLHQLIAVAQRAKAGFSLESILIWLPWPKGLAFWRTAQWLIVTTGLLYALFAGLHTILPHGIFWGFIYALLLSTVFTYANGILLAILAVVFVFLNFGIFVTLGFVVGALLHPIPTDIERKTILRWSYAHLLNNSVKHRLLWKIGNRYIFRHRLLRDYLVACDEKVYKNLRQ